MTAVKDIYDFLDRQMPFSLAEKWDNSGLLVGDAAREVTHVMTCLDMTRDVVREAAEKGVQLIVSHHPVIFDPLRNIGSDSPVYALIQNGISAICSHTCADAADCGTNGIVYELLKDPLSLGEKEYLEPVSENAGIGWVCECAEISPAALAEKLSGIFGGRVKYVEAKKNIKKLGFCSGSGGSFAPFAASLGCTGYITGDVKHDVLVYGVNAGISIFDCGHYETEIFFAEKTAGMISHEFPGLKVFVSQKGKDYIRYF